LTSHSKRIHHNNRDRKNRVREIIIDDSDSKSKEKKNWNDKDEEMLFHWYVNKDVNISQLNAYDFSRVVK
jgi:hypothetical protein